MRMDIAILIAVICAGLLPLFWYKAIDKEYTYNEIFLILACIASAFVVYILAMVSTC